MDRRFQLLVENIPGLSTENVLAMLNLAASLIRPDETYLEIGTWKGLTLVGAMLGNDASFVAIDKFAEPGATASELSEYLHKIGLGGVTLLVGDAVDVLKSDSLDGRRVGVCFYDASHEYEDQLEALLAIERHLAPESLIVIDDADWDPVAAAVRDYLHAKPKPEVLISLPGIRFGSPHWWHGIQVLAWRDRL